MPTATVPKARLAALKVRGSTPVPVRVTSCGLVATPSLKVTAPVTAPAIVGLKVTLMVQLFPPARELPQLLVWEKSPLAAIELMLSGPVPLLARVIGFD